MSCVEENIKVNANGANKNIKNNLVSQIVVKPIDPERTPTAISENIVSTQNLTQRKRTFYTAAPNFGFQIQLGGGMLNQIFDNDKGTSRVISQRVRLNTNYKNWELSTYYRSAVKKSSGPYISPSWFQYHLAYALRNIKLFDMHLALKPILGGEKYRTSKTPTDSSAFKYIEGVDTMYFGFESRFNLSPVWQIGGTYYYNYAASETQKKQGHFVQGDVIYYPWDSWQIGVGYWAQFDSFTENGDITNEKIISLEMFLKYIY